MGYMPPISPYKAGFACKCPRCGQGKLFSSYLGLAEKCEACQFDYTNADTGDGPAVFVIFIVGFLAVAVLAFLQFVVEAPAWVSLGVSMLLAIGLTLGLLRPLKATMVALQYAHKAAEGRIDDEDDAA
ncbi:MAG: DUF983 domain-containing protein [Parvularculaceae bacterium]